MRDIMNLYISQIVLLPFTEQGYEGLVPCDGRFLSAIEFKELYELISDRYGGSTKQNLHNEPPVYYFAVPSLVSPLKEYSYYICVNGIYPQFK